MRLHLILLVCLLAFSSEVLAHSTRTSKAVNTLKQFDNSLSVFFIEYLRYPTTAEGLKLLTEGEPSEANPVGIQFYEGPLNDPWGNPYQYVLLPNQSSPPYELFSFGPDGKSRSLGHDDDDIRMTTPVENHYDLSFKTVFFELLRLTGILFGVAGCAYYLELQAKKYFLARKNRRSLNN